MKRFLSFILLFVLCFALVGCNRHQGGGNIKDVEIPEELTKERIEVEFWHAMGTENQLLIAKIIDDFEKHYAAEGYNINVTQTPLGEYGILRDAITSNIVVGEQPTLAQTYPDHVALYIAGKAMQELDSYNNSKWGLGADQEQYIDGFFAEGKIYDAAGTLYSLPFNKSTEVLYYNKTIFAKYGWEVPQTWDEVVAICEAFAETTEYQNFKNAEKQVAGFSYDSEANLFITFTQQWGGEYTGYEDTTGNGTKVGDKGYILFDNDQSKAAIKFYYENFKKGYMVTKTHFGTNYSSDAFKAGQCIMTLGSSAGAKYNVPTDSSFEVGVAPYPQYSMENPQVIQQGTNVSLFKCPTAEEELAGWLWIKHMISYESALKWALDTSYFPTRKDVLNSEEYQNHILGNKVAGDGSIVQGVQTVAAKAKQAGLLQQDWFYTNIAFPGSSKARDNAEIIVQQILYGSGKSIDKVFADAYNSILND